MSLKYRLFVLLMGASVGHVANAKCWASNQRAPILCATIKPVGTLQKSTCSLDVQIEKFDVFDAQDIDFGYLPKRNKKYTIQLKTESCDAQVVDWTKTRLVLEKICEDRPRPKEAAFQFVQVANSEKYQACR